MTAIQKPKFVIKNILNCSLEQQLQLLEIRNKPSVRDYMFTDHIFSQSEHLSWISSLKDDKTQKAFIILKEGLIAVGALSVSSLNVSQERSEWGFYLDESERGGLGMALEFTMLTYVFDDLKLMKCNADVIETNLLVMNLHSKFGFEKEGFRRSNINKNGGRMGVYVLGLTREDWINKRNDIKISIESRLDRFLIEFPNEEKI